MRATPEMQPAIAQAIAHLEANGARFILRGRSVHGGCRLTSYADAFSECCNMRELQFHLNLFCGANGCATIVLHTTKVNYNAN